MSRSDSLLPVVQPIASRPVKRAAFDWKNRLAVAIRVAMLFLIAVGIRSRSAADREANFERLELTIQHALLLTPDAIAIGSFAEAGQQVDSSDGRSLGSAISTVPAANDVVGYQGPSHCLLLVNEQNVVTQVVLLESKDTVEHVELIQESDDFWNQFIGWEMGAPKSLPDIDAVSGATLTSLAIAESVARRLGQRPESLKFPAPITKQEISKAWPELSQDALIQTYSSHVVVQNPAKQIIGTLIRTGPLCDSIAGYQGPTELLIQLDSNDQVQSISKRGTWDNEPYVSYLDDEPWFWDPFLEQPFEAAAGANLEELGIEGISGATMTSMAAADTLIAAAKEWNRRERQKQLAATEAKIHWTTNDIGSVIVVILGCLIAFTKLRASKKLGALWNVVLLVYFGLVTGNLVSVVVIFGWSASGIAYQLAPGLTLVVATSFLLPALTKRNIYCSHLCPHGAAQQLLRNSVKRKIRFSKTTMKCLTWVPGCVIVFATVVAITGRSFNLAAIEPFNAYIWFASGISSIALAIMSLVWSSFEPMAWCRYGCATGRLLDYIRMSAASAKIGLADIVVAALAAASLGVA